MKLSIFSLKNGILLEVLRLRSKLFDLIIASGKKEFLKKLCFASIRGRLTTVLVAYGIRRFTEMKLKRHFECSFLKIL